jgi:hypothetical protein
MTNFELRLIFKNQIASPGEKMPTNLYAASRSIIARFVILVAVVALALGG